jgi:hypothetical protein
MGLWDHIDSICTYRSNRNHDNTNQQALWYKIKALDRRYEEIWEKHTGLVERLHAIQTKHFGDKQSIGNFNYENKRRWAN